MTGLPIYNTMTFLSQGLDVNRRKGNTLSENLVSQNIPGYVRKESYETQRSLGDFPIGSRVFVKEVVNKQLVEQVRGQHSIVGEKTALSTYFTRIQNLFGPSGVAMTFAHKGKVMADGLDALSKNMDDALYALNALNECSVSVSVMANGIQDLRQEIDVDLSQMTVEASTLLQTIATCNGSIMASQGQTEDSVLDAKLDARRQAIHDLSEMLDVFVVEESNGSLSVYAKTGSELLVGGDQCASFGYTSSTTVSPTSVLSPLTIDGFGRNVNISASVLNVHGSFHALMNLRDTLLPAFQDQADQFAVNLRDTMNVIHNQGSALHPPRTLTGTIGVPLGGPGMGTSGPLTNETVISGNGTFRVATIGQAGNLVGFVDVVLEANTTVGTLVNQINNANIGVTAALTPSGQLSLSANVQTHGVALSGGNLCSGASFSGPSYGVSHFFGLNNLFVSGTNTLGQVPLGASNQLQLRGDMSASNGSFIARGVLNPNPNNPIGSADGSVAMRLSRAYSEANVSFVATATLSAKTMPLDEYATLVVSAQSTLGSQNQAELKGEKFIYDALSKKASEISSVNPSKTMQEFATLMLSQVLLTRAFNILHQMDDLIFDL